MTFGRFPDDHCAVRSIATIASYKGDLPVHTRTADAMSWPEGPGILLFDYDPPPGMPSMEPDPLVAALRAAVPALENVAMMQRSSSSSHIHDADGNELRGRRGQHIYLFVANARDIPEIGRRVVDRLWLAGYGWTA